MRFHRPYILTIVIVFSMTTLVFGQQKRTNSFSIGTNIIKIPALTIDLLCDFHYRPQLDFNFNSGYGFNHTGYDLSRWLTGMIKSGNDGYLMEEQKGWYFKLGARYNIRNNYNSKCYLFIGSYIANSFVKEKAKYDFFSPDSQWVNISHKIYIFGLTCYSGISINIFKHLSLEIGLEAGIPTNKYKELYGYDNFIPGIGVKANSDQSRWFPQILTNIKYNLNNNNP
ncbi:MAG: hypothetical protein COZ21_07250 [Bacteroidetes bacterium CG_4_10_14_3_um_filter_31_20]|nr:MAG: hypothetical protein COZ21_07250 [Bacteroidetes bacterium CG_4_10_14_3_um_filter_31_20]